MPTVRQIIVPTENEVWRHKNDFFVVKSDVMLQVCFDFNIDIERVPDKIRAITTTISKEYLQCCPIANIADGIADWSFVAEHWDLYLLKMYREKAVKTLASLTKCIELLRDL